MQAKHTRTIVLLILVLLGAGWLFVSILGKRFATGNAHPAYSTLRSDPIGAKALYQALDRLPEYEVSRNFRELKKLEVDGKHTLLFLNVPADSWSTVDNKVAGELRHLAASGGRVIVAFGSAAEGLERLHKEAKERREEEEREKKESEAKKKAEDGDKGNDVVEKEQEEDTEKDKEDEEEERDRRPASEIFGISVKGRTFVLTRQGGKQLHWFESNPVLEDDQLPKWYGGSSLDIAKDASSQWRVVATVDTDPVIAERRVGKGSIVLLTDSFFASNEALWKEPAPVFLNWLLGDSRKVIFDEVHLGTQLSDGIMSLVHRYRLQGLFIGTLLVFILFVWQSGSSLIPQRNTRIVTEVVSGQGAVAGLISLFRRGVSRKKLLGAGLDAWQKGRVAKTAATEQRLQQAQAVVNEASSKSLRRGMLKDLYQQISAILNPSVHRKPGATAPEESK